jgi:hypothetical protein
MLTLRSVATDELAVSGAAGAVVALKLYVSFLGSHNSTERHIRTFVS